jgi:hypothetical protein
MSVLIDASVSILGGFHHEAVELVVDVTEHVQVADTVTRLNKVLQDPVHVVASDREQVGIGARVAREVAISCELRELAQ